MTDWQLGWRQKRNYKYLVDVWRMSVAVTAGVPGSQVFALFASAVPCQLEYTDNVSDPNGAGSRQKRRSEFTMDILHTPLRADIRDGDVVVNKTRLAEDIVYLDVSRIEGVQKIVIREFIGSHGKKSLKITTMEHAPAEIVSYYGVV